MRYPRTCDRPIAITAHRTKGHREQGKPGRHLAAVDMRVEEIGVADQEVDVWKHVLDTPLKLND